MLLEGTLVHLLTVGCKTLTPALWGPFAGILYSCAIKTTQIILSDDSKLLTMILGCQIAIYRMSGRPSTLALKVWCWYVKVTGKYKILYATVCMQI